MKTEQTDASQEESPRRVMQNGEVKKGAVFWLVSATPEGEIYRRELVTVARPPYRLNKYGIDFADFEIATPVKRDVPLPLVSLGIKPTATPTLKTNMWLEPYESS
ncbi:MAG: hypothetical protein ABSE17_03015 [Candidatus Levyibacteriota bacterium]|jgi:hypothetical protein